MHYVYLLKSKLNDQIYVGSTNDLKRRFEEHNNGKDFSTKRYKPWEIIYYEAYVKEKLARMREKRLKFNGNAIKELKKRIGLLKTIKSGAGFTLIELIVVFSIITILSSIGFATFVDYSRTQTINQSALDLEAMLNTAKSYSISQLMQNASGQNMCSSQFSGYEVRICLPSGTCDSANRTYSLYIVCGGSIDDLIETKTLPDDLQFSVDPASSTSFRFLALTGGVENIDSTGTEISINGYGKDPKKIKIFPDGRIVQE